MAVRANLEGRDSGLTMDKDFVDSLPDVGKSIKATVDAGEKEIQMQAPEKEVEAPAPVVEEVTMEEIVAAIEEKDLGGEKAKGDILSSADRFAVSPAENVSEQSVQTDKTVELKN